MNFRDPEAMNAGISLLLKYGVIISAAIIIFGTVLLLATEGSSEVSGSTVYDPGRVPHGNFDVSLAGFFRGLSSLDPGSVIELGVLALLATPAARVLFSAFLFAAEGDRIYVYLTTTVFLLLLFSMLVTPFIPGFNA